MVNLRVKLNNERVNEDKMRKVYLILKKGFIINLVFVIVMIASTNLYTYSSYGDYEEYIYVDEIKNLVNKFYPDIEPKIENITNIYLENDICETAYDISYNNISYGYIIIDNEAMSISQFMIQEETEGFCMYNFNRFPDSTEIVIKVDVLKYEIVDDYINVNYVANNNGNNDDIFDIFIDDFPEPMYRNFTMSCKTLGRYCRIDETKIDDLGAKYCCGSVAILNVCGAYGLFSKTDDEQILRAYNKIWSYCDVKNIDEEYVMDQKKIGPVLARYYETVKGKKIPYSQKNNPSIDFFIDAVDKKYASILGVYSRDGEGKCGHAVSVEGYFVFEPINEVVYGEKQIFLMVATGWERESRFIWYDKVNLDSTYGVVFKQFK